MIKDADLEKHLLEQQSLNIEPLCIVELNQNNYFDIDRLGVFKFNQTNDALFANWDYQHLVDDELFYEYDLISSEMHASEKIFETIYFDKRRKRDYFNLADCFVDFRPRSGINKLVKPFTENRSFVDNMISARRPRFYVPSIGDSFKYWTSWINENTKRDNFGQLVVKGYSGLSDSRGFISEAAPFVIYNKALPMNMVSIKIQTGIGDKSPQMTLKQQSDSSKIDKLSSIAYSTIPDIWRIEYLDTFNTWRTIKSFSNYQQANIDPASGALDLVYMVTNPSISRYPNFILRGYVETVYHLPVIARHGDAFVVGRSVKNIGKLYVYDDINDDWIDHGVVKYGWEFYDQSMLESAAIKNLVDPQYYNPSVTDTSKGNATEDHYNDFIVIKGLRIVVKKMVASYKPFELIELSPRLLCNVTSYMIDYSVEKTMGQDTYLLAGEFSVHNGTVTLSNTELLLNRETQFKPLDDVEKDENGEPILDENNKEIPRDRHIGSLLANQVRRHTRFKLYEIIRDVKQVKGTLIFDKIVPVKTFYSTDHPIVFDGNRNLEIELRDASVLFETTKCPNLLLVDCSLSKAVATLLDYAGFSNYIFKEDRPQTQFNASPYTNRIIIPYFYTKDEQTILEALSQLSIATQCPMFFDENNNFVVLPPQHFAADPTYTFYGTKKDDIRANIESIDDISQIEVTDIEVTFTSRGPKQSATYSLMKEMNITITDPQNTKLQPQDTTMNLNLRNTGAIKWGYEPQTLWQGNNSSDLPNGVLTAAVLNSTLTADLPKISVGTKQKLANNTFDVGIYAEYFQDYQGFVLMNGEIIEYDAIEYNIQGKKIWIQSREQLNEQINSATQSLHTLPYAYATGLMRIYVELSEYDIFKGGEAGYNDRYILRTVTGDLKTGRGRFGTPVVNHSATVDAPWNARTKGTTFTDSGTYTLFGDYDKSNWTYAPRTLTMKNVNITTNEYIVNALYTNSSVQNKFPREISSLTPQQIQDMTSQGKIMKSSSIILSGPNTAKPNDIYVKTKTLDGKLYDPLPAGTTTLFGTRLGLIGDPKTLDAKTLRVALDHPNAIGSYVDANGKNKTIYAVSGGLSLLTSNKNPTASGRSNDGYYYEISTFDLPHANASGELFANLRFYKVNNGTPKSTLKPLPSDNICIPLWEGYVSVIPTRGTSTDRTRYAPKSYDVHDLSVEWNTTKKNNVTTHTFILYYNNNKIAVVTDSNKSTGYLPKQYAQLEFGLFVRGKSSVQFEHVYALKNDKKMVPPSIIDDSFDYEWEKPTDFMMFSPSALWAQSIVDGGAKTGGMYYNEFGSIARQVKHVNAKFGLYPTFGAQIQTQPVFDKVYFVSAFTYDPFQASFLLWNMADATIAIQHEKETALSILGIPFRDAEAETLTFRSFLIDRNPGDKLNDVKQFNIRNWYNDMIGADKVRATVKATVESQYIQNREQVKTLFRWTQAFANWARTGISITTFGTPHLQLGDIVDIDYKMPARIQKHAKKNTKKDITPVDKEYEIDYVPLFENRGAFFIKKITLERSEQGPVYKYDLIELPYLTDIFGNALFSGGY